MSDQALDLVDAGVRPLGIGMECLAGVGKMRRVLFWGFLMALPLITSCTSETLFKSKFDATAVNQPPSPTQEVGTANIDGPAGSVLVVASPPDASSGKWVQISRPDNPTQLAAFQGKLAQFPGDGTYVFSTALYMPKDNSGVATIQFEPFNQVVTDYSGFLHLDFLPENRVRIDDDDSTTFGTFPRNQVFIVQVTLNINASSPNAHIVLSGAGASGQADRNVIPPLRPKAQQFGAVRIWMGWPHTGAFQATNIVVTRKS